MAQAATNPKIEELRFRLKTDPKSRLFYQLAEELRKGGQFAESEQVLRSGLGVYPTYLAAWVSLGRVLREQKNDAGAVEALNRAMQLDPGNVVAARLLADAYRNMGETLEAIKKYKLVLALMPGDEELKATVEQLDRDLNPIAVAAPEPEPEPEPEPVVATAPEPEHEPEPEPEPAPIPEDSPFDRTAPPFEVAVATGDVEPMLAAHDESPFEEPVETMTAASIEIDQPSGFHIDPAPITAEVAAPVVLPEDEEADIFAPAAPEPATPHAEELTNTLTMADLYARQGLVNEARHIYENILARDPGNIDVRAKLDAITPHVNPKIERLERWLAKVARKEVGRV